MEREANYAAVGAFVLLVIAMAGLFVYWYTDAREHRDFTRYEVYFYGSVSGLTRGAPVRYLGVDVGRVVSMYIDHRNASRVQVIVDIDSTTPVSEESVAELSQQGLTGVLFIDLLRDAGSKRLLEGVPSERNQVQLRSAAGEPAGDGRSRQRCAGALPAAAGCGQHQVDHTCLRKSGCHDGESSRDHQGIAGADRESACDFG
jgi:hypothetical protein